MNNEELICLTKNINTHLIEAKKRLDLYDTSHKGDVKEQEANLQETRDKFAPVLDELFSSVWDIAKKFDREQYKIFKKYFFEALSPLLLFPEINQYIYSKPLGYPGDFKMMNYIYDYGEKYLGKTSYEKLINYYTCHVPICKCNRIRKEYLKTNILDIIKEKSEKDVIKITSIASGSAREIMELLADNKLNHNVILTLYDFEKNVFDYVTQEYAKIPEKNKQKLEIKYILRNIKDLLLKDDISELIKGQDFIYSIGIFDYLPDRVATKLCKTMYTLLNDEGRMMLCNASEKNASHRAYYEVLGDWNMIYRNEEDIIKWANSLDNSARKYFANPDDLRRYLYYFVSK